MITYQAQEESLTGHPGWNGISCPLVISTATTPTNCDGQKVHGMFNYLTIKCQSRGKIYT